MIERLYPVNWDCAWIASDRHGHLGVFFTAGLGPIPVEAMNNKYMNVDEIEGRLHSLERISGFSLLRETTQSEILTNLAERGLFVYDWSDLHRFEYARINAYELQAKPLNSIKIDSLPDDIKSLLEGLCLDQLSFEDTPILDIRAHRICREGCPSVDAVGDYNHVHSRLRVPCSTDAHPHNDLFQFFGAYFHEDFPEEASTPDGIIEIYIADAPDREKLAHLADLIDAYIAEIPDDQELDEALFKELGCYYYTAADGLTARSWMQHVSRKLRAASERLS
jgi:hypothetical protein